MAGDLLRRGARPGLGSGAGHVCGAGSRQECLWDIVIMAQSYPARCRLGVRVHLFVARHLAVGWGPGNRYVIVPD